MGGPIQRSKYGAAPLREDKKRGVSVVGADSTTNEPSWVLGSPLRTGEVQPDPGTSVCLTHNFVPGFGHAPGLGAVLTAIGRQP